MTPNNHAFHALAPLLALLAAACSAEAGAPAPGNPAQPTSASAPPAVAMPPTPAATIVGNDAGAPDAPAVPSTDAASALRMACQQEALNFCTQYSTKIPDVFAYGRADLQQCLNDYYDGCLAIVEAPDTGWTEQGEVACANAWNAATTSEILFTVPAACRAPAGKKTDGQSCAFDSQCASRTCFMLPGEACGVCGPRIAEGGTCRYTNECGDEASCVDGKCVKNLALAALGTACTSDAQCGYFRYCKGTFTWNETSSTWSLSGACAAFTTVPNGSACGAFFGPGTTTVAHLDVKACDYGYCRMPSEDSNTGVCEARPAVGQPCELEVGCAKGYCIGGICKTLDGNACK